MIVGITFGTFDLFHAGHVLMLKEAKKHCDHLIVCIQVDPTRDRNWKNQPVETIWERSIKLDACRYVDQIVIYETERDVENILKTIKWDVRFLDESYKGLPITAQWTREKCFYTARRHDYSSTELRMRAKEAGVKSNDPE